MTIWGSSSHAFAHRARQEQLQQQPQAQARRARRQQQQPELEVPQPEPHQEHMEEELQPEPQHVMEEEQDQGHEDAVGSDEITAPVVPKIPDEAIPFPDGPTDTTVLQQVYYQVHETRYFWHDMENIEYVHIFFIIIHF